MLKNYLLIQLLNKSFCRKFNNKQKLLEQLNQTNLENLSVKQETQELCRQFSVVIWPDCAQSGHVNIVKTDL